MQNIGRQREYVQGLLAGSRYLTACIYQLILESQISHRIVNLSFEFVIVDSKLTIVWGR